MSNSTELSKQLPDMEYTFVISVNGNVTKRLYEGEFTFKIPNVGTRAKIDKNRALLNEGLDLTLDSTVLDFHLMYSYLKHTLIRVPQWFEAMNHGYDAYDSNLLTEIFKKANEFENKWMEAVWGPMETTPKPSKKK